MVEHPEIAAEDLPDGEQKHNHHSWADKCERDMPDTLENIRTVNFCGLQHFLVNAGDGCQINNRAVTGAFPKTY